jgi:hypothetical protein
MDGAIATSLSVVALKCGEADLGKPRDDPVNLSDDPVIQKN